MGLRGQRDLWGESDTASEAEPRKRRREPADGYASTALTAHLTERAGKRLDYDDYSTVAPLFEEYAGLASDDPRRAELREQLVTVHLPLARHIARRFANRGERLEDLAQVAMVGLIQAIDRFDPFRGVEFLSFGIPTIMGEVRRHFRDQGWSVRVPRRLKELHLSINAAVSELSQHNGRAPTASELAAHLGLSREEVLEGLEAANAYQSTSLDTPVGAEPDAPSLVDTLGGEDSAIDAVEYRQALAPLLAKIPPRERRVLALRFFGNQTQTQIAAEIGVSQMHVSRLLAATLAKLRSGLLEE
ncbi:RNA polymerase sigma factor SigF [Cryptosporangium phraense]|uniref:RNA polymerase sigma factor SigF n=1 Tax=Cryptosporangium phraense TaxID=2593070 RepID=A0A545ALZ2_9ACTN|nr:RNA polymerase sigma factor SigF [Cryptosporangium phraense]